MLRSALEVTTKRKPGGRSIAPKPGVSARGEEAGRGPAAARGEGSSPTEARRTWIAALFLFGVALLARFLFWQATPDSSWPYSSYYKGDAAIWLGYADAIHRGVPFVFGLPVRPPGMAYLVSLLWDGSPSGIVLLRFLWCVLGALAVALFFVAVRRSFGVVVALAAGLGAAASTGLMLLSTSLNNETPYLVLVMAAFCLHGRLRERPLSWIAAVWSALQGLACLVRVEHVIFYISVLAYFAVVWFRRSGATEEEARAAAHGSAAGGRAGFRGTRAAGHDGAAGRRAVPRATGAAAHGIPRRALAPVCASIACFLLPILPWQIHAWRQTQTFNEVVRPSDEGMTPEARAAEAWIQGMTWRPGALEEREKLPGFVRRLASDFVAATVRHRGGTQVGAEDFRILEEAFGYRPEPLRLAFFITSYGPLNFYLGNHSLATGGFNRFGLDLPPPLQGGTPRYYEHLLLEPPSSGTFYFDWPPHLEAFNHGYAKGWEWIRHNPGHTIGLLVKKLGIFWSGATLGFTGYNLPFGLSGIRRSVDLVVPHGSPPVGAWRVAALLVCAAGVAASRRRGAVYPWLMLFVSKVVMVVLFFGYARIGATVAPVVLLLGALALEAFVLPQAPSSWRSGREGRRRLLTLAAAVIGLVVAIEVVRFATRPAVAIDGQIVSEADPFPSPLQKDQEIIVR